MKKIIILAAVCSLAVFGGAAALAATPIAIPSTVDLPPGAMSYGNISSGNYLRDPNVIAAIIGVGGLMVGSIITILATYFIRWMDIRREDKREDLIMARNKKEKEYHMKQEIYRIFLGELAHLETFTSSDIDAMRREWTKMEVKVDLVASAKVRKTKEMLQEMLYSLSEKNLKGKSASLTPEYLKTRDELLAAIREDIDIFQSNE